MENSTIYPTKEVMVWEDKEIECYAESNHKVWIDLGNKVWLNDAVVFRGWLCTIFSITFHKYPVRGTELLLRREHPVSQIVEVKNEQV